MAEREKPRQCALDVNLLYDLAEGKDFAHTLREIFQEAGCKLEVPPTVIQEIVFVADRKIGRERALAMRSLQCMREWGISPFDLIPVGHGITEQFVRRLVHQGLLPANEMNDGLIVAETSLAFIPWLITSDHHLLDIPRERLYECLKDSDMEPVDVFHPKHALRILCG